MNRVEKLQNYEECIDVYYTQYIQSKDKTDLFCFFEGKDDYTFYCPKITAFFSYNINTFYCHSKANVITLYKMIKEQTSINPTNILLFFIDKDYDKNIDIPPDIFITPSYSIENQFLTNTAIERILKGVLGLSDCDDIDKQDYKTAYEYIINQRDALIKQLILPNAWYFLQIQKIQNQTNEPLLSKLKTFNDIIKIKSLKEFEDNVENFIPINQIEINEALEYLNSNPVLYLRGKYLIQGITNDFKYLFENSSQKDSTNRKLKKRRKKIFELNINNFVSNFAQYSDTPLTLRNYLMGKIKN